MTSVGVTCIRLIVCTLTMPRRFFLLGLPLMAVRFDDITSDLTTYVLESRLTRNTIILHLNTQAQTLNNYTFLTTPDIIKFYSTRLNVSLLFSEKLNVYR